MNGISGKIGNKDLNRKVRSDKKVRVNSSLNQDTHRKLKKLSVSCDMTKTSLAAELIHFCLNHEDIVNFFQNKYNQEPEYRIIPIKKNGKVFY